MGKGGEEMDKNFSFDVSYLDLSFMRGVNVTVCNKSQFLKKCIKPYIRNKKISI